MGDPGRGPGRVGNCQSGGSVVRADIPRLRKSGPADHPRAEHTADSPDRPTGAFSRAASGLSPAIMLDLGGAEYGRLRRFFDPAMGIVQRDAGVVVPRRPG